MNQLNIQGGEPSALVDKSTSGKARDWRGKKMRNELLSMAYESIDKGKAERLKNCGKTLTYRVYDDGTKELESMESCRVRLCPICTWRRSLKIYAQTSEIVTALSHDCDYLYVLLTLTVRSCTGTELSGQLDTMLTAWNRFLGYADVKRAVRGWYRSLEIVHDTYPFITQEMYYGDPEKHVRSRRKYYEGLGLNVGDKNPAYDKYHPHFHVVLAVNRSYFTSRDYISQTNWTEYWKKALRCDYAPRVDVRKVKGNTVDELNKAVCEVSKYAAKDADYIVPDDWDLTVNTVKVLDSALANRRLVAYGGMLKTYKALLKLDDVEDGDLIHVGDDAAEHEENEPYRLVSYFWYSGYRQYYEI